MSRNGKILISLNEIRIAFQDLLSDAKTREELSNWAIELMTSRDEDRLAFEPPNEKDRIWDAIMYLTGVDLKDTPNSYLHCKADFEKYIRENLR